ncbi:DUF484 family protein [Alteromonadaceae bacterium M269]|nr:DUF484 family protein [Alteromonadaceae bacterium M269]
MIASVAEQEDADYANALAVRNYLLENPEFFLDFPDLVEKLKIPHKMRGSVSLVELQAEKLRVTVRKLKRKLINLMSVAKENERLYKLYAELNLRLLQCEDLTDIQFALEDVIQDQMALSTVTLKPYFGANCLPEIQQTYFREKRFKRNDFFFGRLSHHESQLLFGEKSAKSVAMILLKDEKELGVLAIGSNDENHFNPDMDTLFIGQLQNFLTILLPTMLEI